MKNINAVKITLDVFMTVVLVLLYSKNAINMMFHEVAGLAILGIFCIHLLLNKKWIGVVTKKLFTKNLPAKTKIGYVVDVLLFICFVAIGVTGVLISKVLFSFEARGMMYKSIHYFASAVSLILMGIHLGLHREFIGRMLRKTPFRLLYGKKAVAVVLTVAIFGFGCYNLSTSGFNRWISGPFMSMGANGGMPRERMMSQGEGAPQMMEGKGQMKRSQGEKPLESGMPSGEAAPEGQRGEKGGGMTKGGDRGFQISRPIGTLWKFFTIMFVFAVLTAFAEKFVNLLKKSRPAKKQVVQELPA